MWTSTDVSAISRSAWYWLIAEATLTGTYGVLASVGANLLYAAVAITGAVLIVARVAAVDRAAAGPVEQRVEEPVQLPTGLATGLAGVPADETGTTSLPVPVAS